MSSAKKHRRFQPATPLKKSKGLMRGGELYSPLSNNLIFEEDSNNNMVIKTV